MDSVSFSVLLTTYKEDSPEELQEALSSVFEQTIPPTEVVIIVDGPIPSELSDVINTYREKYPSKTRPIFLPVNQGLGEALRRGVKECSHDLVARMDADDICVKNRFETQIDYLKSHSDVHVVGGYVGEFENDPDKIQRVRSVPTTPQNVRSSARFRCPANHPTVMFRRHAVLDVGNYRPLRSMQDYDLWMRMLSQGYKIDNIPEILVKFRADSSLYARRGGLEYARHELKLQRDFLRYGAISWPVLLFNLGVRLPIRLIPARLRALIYQKLLRSREV